MIEALEENRQKQQQEWMENLKKSTEESIEQYKSRLENASNSWLLASATTLGQHSQTVLDTLAKAAEKRMRESIAGVLAGMGDTLKDRLLGLSSDLGTKTRTTTLCLRRRSSSLRRNSLFSSLAVAAFRIAAAIPV